MTPVYLNSPPSPFPLIELKEDQASSSLSFPIFFNKTQDQRASDPFIEPKKDTKYISDVGSSEHRAPRPPAYSIHRVVESTKDNHGMSSCKLEANEVEGKRDYESSKWMMSNKTRMVQKMMNTRSNHEKQERIIKIKFHNLDHQKEKCEMNSRSDSGSMVRICSDCKTTKTPLWRSGPQGPKSLCNACGIRQRKARRAMLAAAAAANGTVLTTGNSTTRTNIEHKKEKKSRTSYHVTPYQKPFGSTDPHGGRERILFDDFALSFNKSLGFRQAFPKDEEEAAILLMALSCGLLRN